MTARRSFTIAVARVAKQKKATARRPSPEGLAALARARADDPMRGVRAARRAPRCSKIKRNGERCGGAAMRGADRCAQHGGRRQVPEHPGNVQRWRDGTLLRHDAMQDVRAAGRQALEAMERAEIRELIAIVGAGASSYALAEAAVAWAQSEQDQGKAWREWLRKRL